MSPVQDIYIGSPDSQTILEDDAINERESMEAEDGKSDTGLDAPERPEGPDHGDAGMEPP